jgi:hypothetical protein
VGFSWNNLSHNWLTQPLLHMRMPRHQQHSRMEAAAIPSASVVADAQQMAAFMSFDKKCVNPAAATNTYGWSPTAWFPGFDIAVPKVRGFVLPSGFESKFGWFPRAQSDSDLINTHQYAHHFNSFNDEVMFDSLFGDRMSSIRKNFEQEFFALNALNNHGDFRPTNKSISEMTMSTRKFVPSFDALFRDRKVTPGFCNASLSAINYGLKVIGNKIEAKLLKVRETTTKWTNGTLLSVIGMGSFFNYSPLKSNLELRDEKIARETQCERHVSKVVTTTNMTAISTCRARNGTAPHVAKPVQHHNEVSRCGDKCQALSDLDLFIRSQRENVPIRNITLARMEYKKVLESFENQGDHSHMSMKSAAQKSSNGSYVWSQQSQSRNLQDMMTATRGRRLNNHPLLRAYSRAVQMYRDVSD